MSEPSRLVQKLKLDEMPVTRSQGKFSEAERGARSRGPGRINPLARSITPMPHVGASAPSASAPNISAQHPPDRLDPYISVTQMQNMSLANDEYYAIQLNPVSVRIYSPRGGLGRVTCSCDVFRTVQGPCAHIKWLSAGLNNVLRGVSLFAVPNSLAELAPQLSQLYPLIASRAASLPDDLNRLRDDDSGPPDTAGLSPQATSNSVDRSDDICDMLSTFDNNIIPEEFVRVPQVARLEDCLHRGNLYHTFYLMGMTDDSVVGALRRTVSPDYCAQQYYSKQKQRIDNIFRELDAEEARGTVVSPTVIQGWATALRNIVHQICEDRSRRTVSAVDLFNRPAETLVQLIRSVHERDRDLRVAGARPRTRRSDFNLYAVLIRDPPSLPSAPTWQNDTFVLDGLRTFPYDQWSFMIEELTTLQQEIIVSSDGERGASTFVDKIESMLTEYTRHTNEPSLSSALRRLPRA